MTKNTGMNKLIFELVDVIKQGIESESQSLNNTKEIIDYIYREIYHDYLNPQIISPKDFFYVVTVDKFFVEQKVNNPKILNYLSNFIYTTISLPMSIFNVNNDKLLDITPLNANLTNKDRVEIYETIGDLCLFKSGTVRYFYGNEGKYIINKNRKSFFESGTKAYESASEEVQDENSKKTYSSLSRNFHSYMQGLEQISETFLFNYPKGLFVRKMLEYSSKHSKNPTEYNKKSAKMFKDLVHRHLMETGED